MKMTETEARAKYGEDIINTLLSLPVEPTGRLIYSSFEPQHANLDEYESDGVVVADGTLYAYYFQPREIENLDTCEWSVDNIELV